MNSGTDTDRALKKVTVEKGGDSVEDLLVVEEPLEIRLEGRPLAVLMRTPGASADEDLNLVVGFLATEGVVDGPDDIAGISHCIDPNRPNGQNIVQVRLSSGIRTDPDRFERAQREMYSASSCGLCGKASIERVFVNAPPLVSRVELDEELVTTLPAALRSVQTRFALTGGLHGAALFTRQGSRIFSAEDVGRHNAVDKVIGWSVRTDRFPLNDHILVVSSRAGFEIVQKALVARIAAIVAVGAASSLAHELAIEGNMALYTFVRNGQFNRHT